MFKRIIILLVCVVLSASVFVGCVLFDFDHEHDMRRVVATIAPMPLTDDPAGRMSAERIIYKQDLVHAFNQQGMQHVNNGASFEEAFDAVIRGMITRELLVIEAERLIYSDSIMWNDRWEDERDAQGNYVYLMNNGNPVIEYGHPVRSRILVSQRVHEPISVYNETNELRRQLYAQIDNELMTLQNTILSERNQEHIPDIRDHTLAQPSFPTMPEETPDEVIETEEWFPDIGRWPGGNHLDDRTRSLELNAVRRFVSLIDRLVEEDFRADSAVCRETGVPMRTLFDRDRERLEPLLNYDGEDRLDGVYQIYPILHELYMVEWLIGRHVREQMMLTLLRDVVTTGAHTQDFGRPGRELVTEAQVQQAFRRQRDEQRVDFRANPAAYEAAAANDLILYRPNENMFYVLHILVPFSDQQTARLAAERARVGIDRTEEDVRRVRAGLGAEVVGWPRRHGENIMSEEMTYMQIFEAVYAYVGAAEANRYDAAQRFRRQIYRFNTDPGMFGNSRGYAVGPRPPAGVPEQFVTEFAEGARLVRDIGTAQNRRGGIVLGHSPDGTRGPVLSDFGWHIMVLFDIPQTGSVDISHYETPLRQRTFRDAIREELEAGAIDTEFEQWENHNIRSHLNGRVPRNGVFTHATGVVRIYERAYRNLFTRLD